MDSLQISKMFQLNGLIMNSQAFQDTQTTTDSMCCSLSEEATRQTSSLKLERKRREMQRHRLVWDSFTIIGHLIHSNWAYLSIKYNKIELSCRRGIIIGTPGP